MSVLGVRCSNSDITFAVLRGTRKEPDVLESSTTPFPKGYQTPQRLKWVYQEAIGVLGKHDIQVVVVKRFEGRSRGNSYEARVEAEAAIAIAAAEHGIRAFYKKQNNTIAKDLGLKGKARYLDTQLDHKLVPGFEGLSDKTRDAVIAAWSELS